METSKPVLVKRMPEKLDHRESRKLWEEVQPIATSDRPQLVFDMSNLKQLDAAGVDMLLKCMAEVMRRDGDLKLAAVSPEAALILEMTRTDRFFEIYGSAAEAVRSFSRFLPASMRQQPFSDTASVPRSKPGDGESEIAA